MKSLLLSLLFFLLQNAMLADGISHKLKNEDYPWLNGSSNRGDNSHIYIPDNYDYRLIQQMMRNSGFGPGNGGNDFIFEVDSIVKRIIFTIKENQDEFPEITSETFSKESQTIGLFFVNRIPGDQDRILDAANFPRERAILINVGAWRRLLYKEKVRLIFHEYLGIMKIERENSRISSRILNFINTPNNSIDFETNDIKFLYSRSNTDATGYELSFTPDLKGLFKSGFGEDHFNWKRINKGISLRLTGAIQRKGFDLISVTNDGSTIYVELHENLLEVEISKASTGYYETIETWKSCYVDPSNSSSICSFKIEAYNNLIGKRNLDGEVLSISTGDSIALPIKISSSRLLSSHLVKLLPNGKVKHIEVFGRERIVSWKIVNNSFLYSTSHGAKYRITVVKRQNGIDRVFLQVTSSSNNLVDLAPIAIIKDSLMPSLRQEDIIGEFLPIYSASIHTAEDQEPYFFNDNSTGGFRWTYLDGNDLATETFYWSWSLKKGNRINAKRYMMSPYHPVNSEEGILDCLSQMMICKVNNDRTYVVLKKNGHRYTMLRLFKTFRSDSDWNMSLDSESSSIWVMDKI